MGQHAAGEIDDDDLYCLEEAACPGAGSCSGMFTANTMACVTEALGMSLQGCATAPAVSGKKKRIAYESGRRLVELVQDVYKRQAVGGVPCDCRQAGYHPRRAGLGGPGVGWIEGYEGQA